MRRVPEAPSEDQPPYDANSLESLGCHMLFGEVDVDTAYGACEFILKSNLINLTTEPITLLINTVGGESGDGFSVIDLMETSRIPVATVGIGTVASMGVLLLSGGTKGLRTLTKNADVMAHQFSGYFAGKQHELIAAHTSFKLLEDRFVKHFLRHSSMSQKQIRDVLFAPSDRYLTPAECLKYGLVDRVVQFFDTPYTKPKAKPRRAGPKA